MQQVIIEVKGGIATVQSAPEDIDVVINDLDDIDPKFENHYDCPCGHHWEDVWSCVCDDRCPKCNKSCSPTTSIDIESGEEV